MFRQFWSSARVSSWSTLNARLLKPPHFSFATKAKKSSPAMQQYLDLKVQYPEHIVLFQLGDFYEMFNEDAVKASQMLDIQLTKKRVREAASQSLGEETEEDKIPMAGIPIHALQDYLGKFLKAGSKVVVVAQTEEASVAKQARRVVRREVVRIVTPGTVVEESLLDPRLPNYLLALSAPSSNDELIGLAWVDLSTGELCVASCSEEALPGELARIQPAEVLLPRAITSLSILSACRRFYQTRVAPGSSSHGREQLTGRCDPARLPKTELRSASVLFSYLASTHTGWTSASLTSVNSNPSGDFLVIDAATRSALELTATSQGQRKGSLLHTIDQTSTPGGARLLRSRIQSPLVRVDLIEERLNEAEYFVRHPHIRADTKTLLRQCQDLERSLQRLTLGKGNARDLLAVGHTLELAGRIRSLFAELPPELGRLATLPTKSSLAEEIATAIVPSPPLLMSDGGFVQAGYSEELDKLRQLRDHGRQALATLLQQYRASTGLNSLKLKSTLIGGHYLELAPEHHSKLDPTIFLHIATMKSGMRYKTTELIELETRLADAADDCLALELQLFETLRAKVTTAEGLLATATVLSSVDVAISQADVAHDRAYCRPAVLPEPGQFDIQDGRHPGVELAQTGNAAVAFVGNDCNLSEAARVWLITGPNMGGKSTFLRQNALIVVLAHAGCFVPAAHARLSVVDRLFTRIGSSDDLTNDRSTFMVEMLEAAHIMRTATARSFVIVDELGRGTTSIDGYALARATLEFLHAARSRVLFATHFLQLARQPLPGLTAKRLGVRDETSGPVFLHRLEDGVASHSYGLYCAELAGVPAQVLVRARQIRDQLDGSDLV